MLYLKFHNTCINLQKSSEIDNTVIGIATDSVDYYALVNAALEYIFCCYNYQYY